MIDTLCGIDNNSGSEHDDMIFEFFHKRSYLILPSNLYVEVNIFEDLFVDFITHNIR